MKFIKPFVIAVLQVVVFGGLHDLFLFVFKATGYKYTPNLAWGISVKLSLYIFIIMVLIINYAWLLKLNNKAKHGLIFFCILLFTLFYIKDYTDTPYKVMLLLFCAIIGFLSKYIFDRIIYKKENQ